MRSCIFYIVCATYVFSVVSCSKKNASQEVQVPKAAIFLHYRLPEHHAALKKAIEPLTGPLIQFVWSHVESVQSFSVWIFEIPPPEPGKITPPKIAACLKGKATEWLYTGMLSRLDGKAVSFEKDQLVPVKGPPGAHDTYYLLDTGHHACLGSTEALAREAMRWPEPAMVAADAFFKMRFDIGLLSEMAKNEAFAPMLESLRTLWLLYQIDANQVAKIMANMEAFELEMGMDTHVTIRQRYELLWKNAPSFLQKPKSDHIPFTKHTLLDVHFEMNSGQWMGFDVWPLIEAQNPPKIDGFSDQLKAFIFALQSVDFQLAAEGTRVGARIVITAPGQADFLLKITQKMFETANRNETLSIKTNPDNTWEIHPTTVTDTDVRVFLQRYTDGNLRLSYQQTGDRVTWTLGQWPDATTGTSTTSNVSVSFALLPFFNLFLPIMQENTNADVAFVPYPLVEQDPWTLHILLQPERKAIVAQGTTPLGAWLRAKQKYPAIFQYFQKKNQDTGTGKTKPESDL